MAAPDVPPTPAESLSQLTAASVAPTPDIRRRVLYLMLFRLILISLVLGTTLLLAWITDVDLAAPGSLALFGIIGGTYLLTIVYAVALTRGAEPRRLADAQTAVDLVTTALLVHVTGGAQSAYSFFFPLSIIGAATIRFRAGAVVVFLASATLFAGVSLLGWLEALPALRGQGVLPSDITSAALSRALALNLAAFAGVAVLAVNLGGQIQRTSAHLESQRTVAADLYALHEDIVRSLTSGLITIDADGRVLTLNEIACDILEISAEAAIGRPIGAVMPGIDAKFSALTPRATLSRGDLVVPRPGGESLIVGISVSPLRNNQDEVIGRVVNFQDLTELYAMEEQVKRSERLAAVGTLAAGIAHEIRNPLASISGSIELLRGAPAGDEDSRALMDIVTREIDRLDALIRDLLDYTNPRALEPVPVDLARLVDETVRVFQQDRTFEEIDTRLAPESLERGLEMTADPAKLRQVVWNLLRNAAEAARQGDGHVVVQVSRDSEDAVVAIRDDGPGIAPEHRARIFDPFFTTKARGTGMGLASCQSIVADHGGRLEIDSEPGNGATFTVRLPLDADDRYIRDRE